MTFGEDARWMRAAIALARRGLGTTGENPSVGCLIVRDGRVLGRGATAPGGRPHAETRALADARQRGGDAAPDGATAYVTLEPCAHQGRTPPCTAALIGAGVSRVVTAIRDPDPRVSGRGHAALLAAGVSLTEGVEAAAASALLDGYLRRMGEGRPSVTLKLATTLDGRIATRSGESRWITGPAARRRVHLMRAQHDCILVGSGTLRADDPRLDIRLPGLDSRTPLRAIADRTLMASPQARMLTDGEAQVLILGDAQANAERAAALSAAGARILPLARDAGPQALLRRLGEQGISRVFCEGGGKLAASLLQAGLVERLAVFTAGAALGADAIPAVGALGLDRLADAPRFALLHSSIVGADVLSVWERAQLAEEQDGCSPES